MPLRGEIFFEGLVATALTVYGIETPSNPSCLFTFKRVATALTVYGIETRR